MTTDTYVAYIGIDGADRKHDIALYDCASNSWQESVIPSRPQDILDWVNLLRTRYGEGRIAVATEQKRGPYSTPFASTTTWCSFPLIPVPLPTIAKPSSPPVPSLTRWMPAS